MDLFSYHNYRTFLLELFQEKALANPSFSMRAWAKTLGIDHTLLHKIIKGERKLPTHLKQDLSKKLKFNEKESRYFSLLVEYDHHQDEKVKELIFKEMRITHVREKFNDLSLEQFNQLDFCDIVIIEMTELKDFHFKAETIAQKLKLSLETVHQKLEKLIRLGILLEKEGTWSKAEEKLHLKINFSDKSVHQYFKDLNARSNFHIDHGSPNKRVFRSRIISISPEKGQVFAKMLDRFMAELDEAFQDDKPKERIACFNMQYFPLWEES